MKYQITYEDAVKISNAYKNFNFYPTEWLIDGYNVVTFNYFLCDYNYFVKPLVNSPEINARDMRGVTFVFNTDGTLYKRFLMLAKFFNVNQVAETQFNLLKDKKIKYITVKEDGSLIAFMQLPNGKVFAKTQGGCTNDQSIAANDIYLKDVNLKKFVDEALEAGLTPLFEYVAFDNRIVLKYSKRELRLIGVRDNKYGEYFSACELTEGIAPIKLHIPYIKSMEMMTLTELEELMKTAVDIEGAVVEFEDGMMVKIKSTWYWNLHGIRTVSIFREDYVIRNYLEETLDDATQELNMTDDADAFKFIDYVKKSVTNWSNHIEETVDALVTEYNSTFYYSNWAKFATDKHKAPYFGLARNKIENPEEYMKYKIGFMINKTKHLYDAKHIVEKWI